jgi:glycosyltransferase involved in cell wall biosynthesis
MATGVLWCGPLFDRGGYGAVARNYVLGLHRIGVPVRAVATGAQHPELEPEVEALIRRLEHTDLGPEPVAVLHDQPASFGALRRALPREVRRVIGCTIFETDRLPDGWAEGCREVDELWVPTQFNLETFSRAGVEPGRIRVVPYGIDTRAFAAAAPLARTDGPFRFLYAFAYDYRKGVDLLLEAFLSEFRRGEGVQLVLKGYLPSTFQPWRWNGPLPLSAELQRFLVGRVDLLSPDLPAVEVLDGPLAHAEMLELYRSCDAYVSTDRANGWGMPCMEAMALGIPAAAIDWSGSREFMNAENSFLIQPQPELEPVDVRLQEMRPLYRGHRWPRVRVAEVRAVLRRIFEDRAARERLARRARADIENHYRVEVIAERAAAALGIQPGAVCERAPAGLTYEAPLLEVDSTLSRGVVLGLAAAGVQVRAVPAWTSGGPALRRCAANEVPASAQPVELGDGTKLRVALAGDETEAHALYLRGPDGATLEYRTRVERGELLRVLGLIGRPAPADLYVVHGIPAAGGLDHWAAARRANPGYRTYAGSSMFETDGLPPGWAEACNGMDRVWVPTHFNADTFRRAGVAAGKLVVLPLGVDAERFDPAAAAPLAIPEQTGFTFLSTFQWTRRKGWDVLLRAYLGAFERWDDVTLLIRSYHGRGEPVSERIRACLAELGREPDDIPRIVVLERAIPERLLPSLYAACDAYVLPSRGEGWGLPYLEAMAMARPVIATRWSGNLEYMTDTNSYLIDVEGVVPVDAEQLRDSPLYAGQRWAEPSLRHTQELMRRVFEQRDEARLRGKAAREDVLRTWTRAHQAGRIRAHLAELAR